jgi:hypothetical protein
LLPGCLTFATALLDHVGALFGGLVLNVRPPLRDFLLDFAGGCAQ